MKIGEVIIPKNFHEYYNWYLKNSDSKYEVFIVVKKENQPMSFFLTQMPSMLLYVFTIESIFFQFYQ